MGNFELFEKQIENFCKIFLYQIDKDGENKYQTSQTEINIYYTVLLQFL